jgi:hypothetical protein
MVPSVPELPDPQDAFALARRTSAQILSRDSTDYEVTLPFDNVSSGGGDTAVFEAGYDSLNPGFEDLAFAIYSFDLEGFNGQRQLRLRTGAPNFDWSSGTFFIGVADASADHWTWLLPAVQFQPLYDLSPYVAEGSTFLVALVSLDLRPLTIEQITLIDYDEIENNDTEDGANTLPSAIIGGWRGSIGSDVSYPGYDGDNADWVLIPAATGQSLSAVISFDESTAELLVKLYRQDGTLADSRDTSLYVGDKAFISDYSAAPGDFPYTLSIEPLSGYSDYVLDSAVGSYPFPDLVVTPVEGDAPLTVTLDASGSTDPDNDIDHFEFNVKPGVVISTPDPVIDYTYISDGIYNPTVKAVDALGFASSTFDKAVLVGSNPYDEVEDNDSESTPNLLPHDSPANGWNGNVGFGFLEDFPSYDGDDLDFVRIPDLLNGEAVSIGIEIIAGNATKLYMGSPNQPEYDSGVSFATTRYQMTNLAGLPENGWTFPIQTWNFGVGADYKLTWKYGNPPTDVQAVAEPDGGDVPITIDFTGSATAGDAPIVSYHWDFDPQMEGWGEDAQGQQVSHTFTESNISQQVRLDVVDAEGFWATTSISFPLFDP